ncbi:hypothetical protein KAI92_04825 [Candidatus Parcubacteria bacterium]|nr:hypothetical protein [Candidatus Parcubacteria bacterium]
MEIFKDPAEEIFNKREELKNSRRKKLENINKEESQDSDFDIQKEIEEKEEKLIGRFEEIVNSEKKAGEKIVDLEKLEGEIYDSELFHKSDILFEITEKISNEVEKLRNELVMGDIDMSSEESIITEKDEERKEDSESEEEQIKKWNDAEVSNNEGENEDKVEKSEEILAEEAINELNEKEKKTFFEGLANLGYRTTEIKSGILSKFCRKISSTEKVKNIKIANTFFNKFADIYDKKGEQAKKERETVGKGVLKKGSGIGQGFGNLFKYGRTLVDVVQTGSSRMLNPFRHVTVAAMALGSSAEAVKETRLDNEKVKESTRVDDVDRAMDEALDLYENAKNDKGEVTAENLTKLYQENLPKDIIERLNRAENVGAKFCEKLLNKDAKVYVDRIIKKIDGINNKNWDEQKKAEKIQFLMQKNEELLNDLDRIVGDEAGVDQIAYWSRVAEKTGKGVATVMIIDSVARMAKVAVNNCEVFDNFQNSVKNVGDTLEDVKDKMSDSFNGSDVDVTKGMTDYQLETFNKYRQWAKLLGAENEFSDSELADENISEGREGKAYERFEKKAKFRLLEKLHIEVAQQGDGENWVDDDGNNHVKFINKGVSYEEVTDKNGNLISKNSNGKLIGAKWDYKSKSYVMSDFDEGESSIDGDELKQEKNDVSNDVSSNDSEKQSGTDTFQEMTTKDLPDNRILIQELVDEGVNEDVAKIVGADGEKSVEEEVVINSEVSDSAKVKILENGLEKENADGLEYLKERKVYTRPSIMNGDSDKQKKIYEEFQNAIKANIEKTGDVQKALATVYKGEGIEHAFIRQLQANSELAEKLGFDARETNLDDWSKQKAHEIATEAGYYSKEGEIRINKADHAAYYLKFNDGKLVAEEYVKSPGVGYINTLINDRDTKLDAKILDLNDGKILHELENENEIEPHEKIFKEKIKTVPDNPIKQHISLSSEKAEMTERMAEFQNFSIEEQIERLNQLDSQIKEAQIGTVYDNRNSLDASKEWDRLSKLKNNLFDLHKNFLIKEINSDLVGNNPFSNKDVEIIIDKVGNNLTEEKVEFIKNYVSIKDDRTPIINNLKDIFEIHDRYSNFSYDQIADKITSIPDLAKENKTLYTLFQLVKDHGGNFNTQMVGELFNNVQGVGETVVKRGVTIVQDIQIGNKPKFNMLLGVDGNNLKFGLDGQAWNDYGTSGHFGSQKPALNVTDENIKKINTEGLKTVTDINPKRR